jgi:hypothetical protein
MPWQLMPWQGALEQAATNTPNNDLQLRISADLGFESRADHARRSSPFLRRSIRVAVQGRVEVHCAGERVASSRSSARFIVWLMTPTG